MKHQKHFRESDGNSIVRSSSFDENHIAQIGHSTFSFLLLNLVNSSNRLNYTGASLAMESTYCLSIVIFHIQLTQIDLQIVIISTLLFVDSVNSFLIFHIVQMKFCLSTHSKIDSIK